MHSAVDDTFPVTDTGSNVPNEVAMTANPGRRGEAPTGALRPHRDFDNQDEDRAMSVPVFRDHENPEPQINLALAILNQRNWCDACKPHAEQVAEALEGFRVQDFNTPSDARDVA